VAKKAELKKKQEEEEQRTALNKPVVVKSKVNKKDADNLDDLLSAGLGKGKKKWYVCAPQEYLFGRERRVLRQNRFQFRRQTKHCKNESIYIPSAS